MTKILTDEEVRAKWREEVKRWPEMDALGSADWWLDLRKNDRAGLIEAVEGMRKELKSSKQDVTTDMLLDQLDEFEALLNPPTS